MLIRRDEGSGLTRAEAGACMPYWLEAAGWLMAAVAEGAAAAMGRRAAAEASQARSTLRETVGSAGTGAMSVGLRRFGRAWLAPGEEEMTSYPGDNEFSGVWRKVSVRDGH